MEITVKKGGEETRNGERAGLGEKQVLKRDGVGKAKSRGREPRLKSEILGIGTGSVCVSNAQWGRLSLITLTCF